MGAAGFVLPSRTPFPCRGAWAVKLLAYLSGWDWRSMTRGRGMTRGRCPERLLMHFLPVPGYTAGEMSQICGKLSSDLRYDIFYGIRKSVSRPRAVLVLRRPIALRISSSSGGPSLTGMRLVSVEPPPSSAVLRAHASCTPSTTPVHAIGLWWLVVAEL